MRDSGKETRSQVQDGDEQTAVADVQAQEEDTTGNGNKERQTARRVVAVRMKTKLYRVFSAIRLA
jgi:hypothetical protein